MSLSDDELVAMAAMGLDVPPELRARARDLVSELSRRELGGRKTIRATRYAVGGTTRIHGDKTDFWRIDDVGSGLAGKQFVEGFVALVRDRAIAERIVGVLNDDARRDKFQGRSGRDEIAPSCRGNGVG